MKRSRITSAVIAGTTVTLAVSLVAAGASAATTYNVSAGSAKSGASVSYTGKTTSVKFVDTTSNTSLSCKGATAGGKLTVGKGESGTKLGTISGSSTTWKSCTGPDGIALTPVGTGTWALNATKSSGGVTTGTISAVKATVSANPASLCSFTVTGSVPVTFTNSSQSLTVSPSKSTLTITKVTGCFNLIKNNDKSSFAATYKVTTAKAADSPIKITSS